MHQGRDTNGNDDGVSVGLFVVSNDNGTLVRLLVGLFAVGDNDGTSIGLLVGLYVIGDYDEVASVKLFCWTLRGWA